MAEKTISRIIEPSNYNRSADFAVLVSIAPPASCQREPVKLVLGRFNMRFQGGSRIPVTEERRALAALDGKVDDVGLSPNGGDGQRVDTRGERGRS